MDASAYLVSHVFVVDTDPDGMVSRSDIDEVCEVWRA